MALKADTKYDGKIAEGSYFSYSVNGNLAFNIRIDYEGGSTTFPLWLTEKNREKATKTLANLGADTSQLSNQNYLDFELPKIVTGKEISFGTKEDTYQGKTTVKVAWIGKRTDPNVARGAASFFSGNQPMLKERKPTEPEFGDPGITDQDVPF